MKTKEKKEGQNWCFRYVGVERLKWIDIEINENLLNKKKVKQNVFTYNSDMNG